MANRVFPQMKSGASAQYPVRKTMVTRTVKNVLPDGEVILFSDPQAGKILWQLAYECLSLTDINALKTFFAECQGRFYGFTFIDPTENMLVNSANLVSPPWEVGSSIEVAGQAGDPSGGTSAFAVTNYGQTSQSLSQTLDVPAGYQYCFSIYARSDEPATIALTRQGSAAKETTVGATDTQWVRIVSSGTLVDAGTSITISVDLTAGQRAILYGPQLEVQPAPSRFRPTFATGGVYVNAHWGMDELPISEGVLNFV